MLTEDPTRKGPVKLSLRVGPAVFWVIAMALVKVDIKANINKTVHVIAESDQDAAEKAKRMFWNEFHCIPSDLIDCAVELIEGEFQSGSQTTNENY